LFERAWRIGDFKCSDQELIDEKFVFIQTGNSMGARSGYHDDRIMAAAIGWYVVCTSAAGVPDFVSAGQKQNFARAKAY
jgi:hypothetical protein